MQFNELDTVRVTRPLNGDDPFRRRPVYVPAGQKGAVLVGGPDAYDVEFVLRNAQGEPYSAVLVVQKDDLEPWQ